MMSVFSLEEIILLAETVMSSTYLVYLKPFLARESTNSLSRDHSIKLPI